MKLKVETFSILYFLKVFYQRIIDSFVKQSPDKSLQYRHGICLRRGLFLELGHFYTHRKHNFGKKFGVFLQEKLKNCILNQKFSLYMIKISTLFLKVRALSSNFQECEVESFPSPPSSYAPVVIRKYRMPLFTKFAIVKLKIDLFSVFMIFLKSALRWKVSVACFVERSLPGPPYIIKCVKQLFTH